MWFKKLEKTNTVNLLLVKVGTLFRMNMSRWWSVFYIVETNLSKPDKYQKWAHTSVTPVHRGAFCQFIFRWFYYCHSSKSTGKKTAKTHLCAVVEFWGQESTGSIDLCSKVSFRYLSGFWFSLTFEWVVKNWASFRKQIVSKICT